MRCLPPLPRRTLMRPSATSEGRRLKASLILNPDRHSSAISARLRTASGPAPRTAYNQPEDLILRQGLGWYRRPLADAITSPRPEEPTAEIQSPSKIRCRL